MKNFLRDREHPLSYTEKIRRRIRLLRLLVVAMLIYMIVISELGGGNSRVITGLADMTADMIFFGGLIFVLYRIHHNKKLLRDRLRLREQMITEQDERGQYLHDKSGGIVMDLLLILLLFLTMTTAMFNMDAFSVSLAILGAALFLKGAAYLIYSHASL